MKKLNPQSALPVLFVVAALFMTFGGGRLAAIGEQIGAVRKDSLRELSDGVNSQAVGAEAQGEHDLGDAPDSSNSFPGVSMLAYPATGVVANYPTIYWTSFPPYGPIHWQPNAWIHLGRTVTSESRADHGYDEDPDNNLKPTDDLSDLDGGDDGVQLPLVLPHCQEATFDYTVTVLAPNPSSAYVNVWFDWNRDGDWDDTVVCPDGVTVPEWAVQNESITNNFIGSVVLTTPPFMCWHPQLETKLDPMWMRITISLQPWDMWDMIENLQIFPEDFNDGNYNGWQLVDQGTNDGPMDWSAATGVMVQSSNAYLPPTGTELPKLGTYALWQGGIDWTDYTTAVTIKSTDDDAIGIMFRYQDENNYYRFSWDQQRSSRRLVKCVAGQFTLLVEDSVPYVTGQNYQLEIVAQGTILQVFIDGSLIFSVNDSSLSWGTIALYCWGNAESYFDDIVVESATAVGGSGPAEGYEYGETEDYTVVIEEGSQPTSRPISPTQCPAVQTRCPAVDTECHAVETKCPTVMTKCPPTNTICQGGDTQCPAVSTKCPSVATECPSVMTRCPPTSTICQGGDTQCPAVSTKCPSVYTQCPSMYTYCPEEYTFCPDEHTKCPSVSTECPPISTRCPAVNTQCPAVNTQCPAVNTECPPEPTNCPAIDTECPPVSTNCPAEYTECPVESTRCPAVHTSCPRTMTSCQQQDTICPQDPTRCPAMITWCFQVPTECPMADTICPVVHTQCPPESTSCPYTESVCVCMIETYQPGCPMPLTVYPFCRGDTKSFTAAVLGDCPAIEVQCPAVVPEYLLTKAR